MFYGRFVEDAGGALVLSLESLFTGLCGLSEEHWLSTDREGECTRPIIINSSINVFIM